MATDRHDALPTTDVLNIYTYEIYVSDNFSFKLKIFL